MINKIETSASMVGQIACALAMINAGADMLESIVGDGETGPAICALPWMIFEDCLSDESLQTLQKKIDAIGDKYDWNIKCEATPKKGGAE